MEATGSQSLGEGGLRPAGGAASLPEGEATDRSRRKVFGAED